MRDYAERAVMTDGGANQRWHSWLLQLPEVTKLREKRLLLEGMEDALA